MNKDKLKLWVNALRSGEYAQVNGQLGRVGEDGKVSYCCLGVACEVAIKDGLNLGVHVGKFEGASCNCEDCMYGDPDTVYYDNEESTLPIAVREWLGLDGDMPTPTIPADPEIRAAFSNAGYYADEHVTVIEMNDEAKMNFGQIADALEAAYLKEDSE